MTLCNRIMLAFLSALLVSGCVSEPDQYDRSKVFKQEFLIKDARKVAESGDYERAIAMCEEASGEEYINYPADKHRPLGLKMNIYKIIGDYDKAIETFDLFIALAENPPEQSPFKNEMIALRDYKNSGDPRSVYTYIEAAQNEWAAMMPPQGFSPGAVTRIAKILRLYDTIGDHDAAIAYINMVMEYSYRKHPGLQMPTTSQEAIERMRASTGENQKYRRRYEIDTEYLKLREAFEQDRREGKRGRATQAIIQSDYFPW
jgi:tetratricopeptide (TPR) repeat protein